MMNFLFFDNLVFNVIKPAMKYIILLTFIIFLSAQTQGNTRVNHDFYPTNPNINASSIDPRIFSIQHILKKFGTNSLFFGENAYPNSTGVSATLRFSSPLNIQESSHFQSLGVEFNRDPSGKILHYKNLYPVFLKWRSLAFLEKETNLQYAQCSWFPTTADHPLMETTPYIHADSVHQFPFQHDQLTGKGRRVADIDSGIDVLHPHFFFANGPIKDWFDANQNNVFDPGIDGIDINQDFEITSNEILGVAFGNVFRPPNTIEERKFRTNRDWLFLDRNRDGQRNAGVSEGFTEEDPAYGEPIFVVEDLNGNSQLDPFEHLIQLNTSKIIKLVTKTKTYLRGKNLIDAPQDIDENKFSHGTSVASILIGGQYPYHSHVGIAPKAELFMYMSDPEDQNLAVKAVLDAVENNVDVILHEWTESLISPLDGSGNYEALLQKVREDGGFSVNPVGNLNEADKHLEIKSTGSIALPFLVGEGLGAPHSNLRISIFWKDNILPNFSLRSPSGDNFVFLIDGKSHDLTNALTVLGTHSKSTRGFHHVILTLWNQQRKPLWAGEWKLEISNLNTKLWARIGDPKSGWGQGVRWKEPTRDHGTAVFPATADAAFGVGAFGVHHDPDSLRRFSGRGPRIDNHRILDIAAPADPIAAFASTQVRQRENLGRSWLTMFDGTSGAAPHVAGTVLLLHQQARLKNSPISPDQIKEMLQQSASSQHILENIPNVGWGFGMLDSYATLFGKLAPENNHAPILHAYQNGTWLHTENSVDPEGDALEFRVDFEYDGIFDSSWTTNSRFKLLEKTKRVRIEVRDSKGARASLLFFVEEQETPTPLLLTGGGTCRVAIASSAFASPIFLFFFFVIVRVKSLRNLS